MVSDPCSASSTRLQPIGVVLADRIGRLIHISPEVRELLNLDNQAEVPNTNLASIMEAEGESILPLRHWQGWVSLRCRDGSLADAYARIEYVPKYLGGELGFVVNLSIQQQSPLAQDMAELEHSRQRRLKSLGTLAGVIAHDVNNILTGVLGHVSFLKLILIKEGGYSESINAIEDGARRAAMMTQQILDFTKGDAGERHRVNLSQVVAKSVELLRATLSTDVRLTLDISDPSVFIKGRESQLSQVVMNLTVNARDAVSAGGTISVMLEEVNVSTSSSVRVGELEPGRYARLVISDDGVGIPPEIRERMFEPFFTTKVHAGTGLGLATVFSVVRSHYGGLEVDSELGKGTVFRVYLPITEISQFDSSYQKPEDSPEDSDDSFVPKGTERVLVVDDEDSVRMVVQRSLEHLGYQVDVAENGLSALELYARNKGAYSLVILDMMMPKMPGDEVFYNLKEMNPNVPVLIASGYASDGRTRAIMESGGLGFIQKPFAVEELAREVRDCLDRSKGGES